MTHSNVTAPSLSVSQRAQKIMAWLGQINTVYIVIGVLYLLSMVLSLAGMGNLAGSSSAMGSVMGGLLLMSLLVLGSMVLYALAIRAARQAIKAVSDLAEGQTPPQLQADLQRFGRWLTAGQWLSLVGAVLGTLFSVASTRLMPSDPELGSVGPLMVLPSIFSSLISVVLSWLIYGAIKGFFAAVSQRSRGEAQAVTPAAERAASWLQFVYIVQWIGAVVAGLGFLAFFLMLVAEGGDSAYAIGALTGVALMLAVIGWLISLSVRLIGHSRLFALEAARQLDQGRHAGVALTPDPWGER